jgi:hypothetical protein
MFEIKGKTVVINANFFNPSIFNTHWFIKNSILKEEEILPNSIFTPEIAQINSNNFNIVVTLNQLITNILLADPCNAMSVISKCVECLPHIPYSASGINFNFHVPINNSGEDSISRQLFFKTESPIYKEFDTLDAKFGAYLSKDFNGCRLKLDIKPNTIQVFNNPLKSYVLNFGFNFHLDLPKDNCAEDLIKFLDSWKIFESYSNELMNKIFSK